MVNPGKRSVLYHDTEPLPPPPSYEFAISQQYDEQGINFQQEIECPAQVTEDGRIQVDFNSRLVKTLSKLISDPPDFSTWEKEEESKLHWETKFSLKLNIVIQIVGSRGDVQPLIALGNELQTHGHRVRLATHDVFKDFVLKHGLEFYPIGGNPEELMAYMVKNPGLIPGMKSLKGGEIGRKRAMVAEMLDGCWKSCISPDTVSSRPFVADAIIANPPSFAHIHCAQALGIPVHLMFTMPWTNTKAFSHPLANLKHVENQQSIANYISYTIVDWMTWQGLGDVINKWRHTLDLEPITGMAGVTIVSSLKIPFIYCWSPSLIPKPRDWAPHIDVCGFFFRDPPNYNPPFGLHKFLCRGSPPVYIGFGSIVIEDPQRMTYIILEAVRACGVRAIISRGWSRLGGPELEDVFYLDDCPHEWLFQHVSAVVHHGGAGTAACGLLNGRPTTVVPFFGDQPFWGNMIAAAGAGPSPIPYKMLDVQNLSRAISFCLTQEALSAARGIAARMRAESGVKNAVKSFHNNLPFERMACEIFPDQPAAWLHSKAGKTLRLSKLAAELLIRQSKLDFKKLQIYTSKPIIIDNHHCDPISSTTMAFASTQIDVFKASTGIFYQPYKVYKSRHDGVGTSEVPSGSISNSDYMSTKDTKENNNYSSIKPKSTSIATGHQSGWITTKAMMAASGKSLGDFYVKGFKGLAVDIPVATADGLKNLPRLYGDEVRDNGSVTDWKSGAMVGGKTFMYGMAEGLTGIFVQPYKGARDEGPIGALKGFGKGTASLFTKTASGGVGLVAYPGQGICKSILSAVKSKTRKSIMEARHQEGMYLLQLADANGLDREGAAAFFESRTMIC